MVRAGSKIGIVPTCIDCGENAKESRAYIELATLLSRGRAKRRDENEAEQG